MQNIIPKSQAVYQGGRGATEQIFAIKILAEKAITALDYEINVLLLDMSKAFDTIQRETLLDDLKLVLDADEMHMFYILLKDVEIQIRVDKILVIQSLLILVHHKVTQQVPFCLYFI